MITNVINQIIKWIKNELIPLLIVGTLITMSMAFVYYLITGTIILLIGGQHIFAFTIWSLLLIALLYFLALSLPPLWENKQTEITEKLKPTIAYITLITLVDYLTITSGHVKLFATVCIFSLIGAITGHCFNREITKNLRHYLRFFIITTS